MNTRSSMPNLLQEGKTVKTCKGPMRMPKNPKPADAKKTGKPKMPKKPNPFTKKGY